MVRSVEAQCAMVLLRFLRVSRSALDHSGWDVGVRVDADTDR